MSSDDNLSPLAKAVQHEWFNMTAPTSEAHNDLMAAAYSVAWDAVDAILKEAVDQLNVELRIHDDHINPVPPHLQIWTYGADGCTPVESKRPLRALLELSGLGEWIENGTIEEGFVPYRDQLVSELEQMARDLRELKTIPDYQPGSNE